MIDYEQIIQNLIQSLIDFSFEFSFDEVKSKMELREVPKEELELLGTEKVKENFENGIFIMKLSDEKFIDANSLYKHCKENNIKEPVLFVNPNFKYVRWEITEDLTTPQIKRHIKRQLTNNNGINLDEVHKALIKEDIKNKQIDGYLDKTPIKTSNYIQQGKFYIQSTCDSQNAYKLIEEAINELQEEKTGYIKRKIKKDRNNACWYFVFIVVILTFWLVNNYCEVIPKWLSISIGIILYLVPLVVLRLIDHSFIQSVFCRKKAETKYEKEFNSRVN